MFQISRHRFRLCRLALPLLHLAVLGAGCGSLSMLTRKEHIEEELAKNPKYSIDGIQGPAERGLSRDRWNKHQQEYAEGGDEATALALANLEAARSLYDDGKYAEAEKAFHELAKERRGTYESFGQRFKRAWGLADKPSLDYGVYGDPVEEDALFMEAESQYAQRHYAAAQNSYEKLLQSYPSTRHLDPTTRQLFRIARYWMGFPEDVGANGDTEIRLASKETEVGVPEKPDHEPSALSRVPVFPNLTDDSRPLFDTYGRAEQALRSIWLHDATGPLADDALMLAANHNLRTGDFVEARRLYSLLREQYPDSPHLKDAYLLGSHVTLASYQGPEYDGQTLEESRELKEAALQLFADLSPEQRKQLQQEVNLLREAEVDRIWNKVDFYRAKRNEPAMKLHCYLILNKYPDSSYATKAREMLIFLQEREEQRNNSIWNFNRKSPAQQASTPSRGEKNQQTPPVDSQGTTENKPQPPKRSWFNPLKKAEQPPELQPAEDRSEPAEKADDPPASPQSPGRTRLEEG
jgi:outer membrane protein assembly factor BamD (BamD/ComL family)